MFQERIKTWHILKNGYCNRNSAYNVGLFRYCLFYNEVIEMKFEDALKAMREGKKVRCLSLSPNTFELEPWTKRFFVNDGMNLLPIL